MRHLPILIVILAISGFPSIATADCPKAPALRLFSAQGGGTFLRVVTADRGSRSEASLYRFVGTQEQLIWRASLPNVPHDVWIDSGARWVVTRGNYCDGAGQVHALAVYDARGALVRDWRRSELATDEELGRRQTIFEAHTPWTASAPLQFEISGDGLTVVLPWGESRVLVAAVKR